MVDMRYGALEGSESETDITDFTDGDISVNRNRGVSRVNALIAFIAIVIASVCISNYKSVRSSKITEFTTTAANDQLIIIATNEYGIYEGPYPWLDNIPGSQIVEPYKLTTLTTSMDSMSPKSIAFYRWTFSENVTVVGHHNDSNTGQCNITIAELGNHDVTVRGFDDAGNLISSFSTLLMCK